MRQTFGCWASDAKDAGSATLQSTARSRIRRRCDAWSCRWPVESSSNTLSLRNVALDDKDELESGRVYLTGVQALVRLLMLQRQRDKLAGLTTAGFVSGYRGSPLGGLDLALWGAAKFRERAQIKFQPCLN